MIGLLVGLGVALTLGIGAALALGTWFARRHVGQAVIFLLLGLLPVLFFWGIAKTYSDNANSFRKMAYMSQPPLESAVQAAIGRDATQADNTALLWNGGVLSGAVFEIALLWIWFGRRRSPSLADARRHDRGAS